MLSTMGRARAVTDAQVQRILKWQRERKTLVQVARENRVSVNTISWVIQNAGRYKRSSPLAEAEVRRILEWRGTLKTFIQVAQENGVSTSTLRKVIRAFGQSRSSRRRRT